MESGFATTKYVLSKDFNLAQKVCLIGLFRNMTDEEIAEALDIGCCEVRGLIQGLRMTMDVATTKELIIAIRKIDSFKSI